MRRAGSSRIGPILMLGLNDPGIATLSDCPQIIQTQHECAAVQILPCVWQAICGKQRQIVGNMRVSVIDLLADTVLHDILVEPSSAPRVVSQRDRKSVV